MKWTETKIVTFLLSRHNPPPSPVQWPRLVKRSVPCRLCGGEQTWHRVQVLLQLIITQHSFEWWFYHLYDWLVLSIGTALSEAKVNNFKLKILLFFPFIQDKQPIKWQHWLTLPSYVSVILVVSLFHPGRRSWPLHPFLPRVSVLPWSVRMRTEVSNL